MSDRSAMPPAAGDRAVVAPPAREVHLWRLLVAVLVGCAAAWLGQRLPFPADQHPLPAGQLEAGVAACRLLFVVGLTTSCWLLGAMPIAAASLLPLALLPLFGVQSTVDATRGYGDPILWLFGGGFVVAQAIERCGLHRRIALRIVAALGPSPRRLVLGFLLSATAVSMWINNTAVALLLLPIGTVLILRTRDLGELAPRALANFGAAVMCAIAYGATIGGLGSPIGTAPNALFFGSYEPLVAGGARPVSFLTWMLAFAPYAVVLAAVAWLVLVRVALPIPRGELRGGGELLAEGRALPRWSAAELRTAALFGAAVLLWTTRGDLDFGSGVVHGWAHYLVPPGERDRFIADGSVAVLVAIAAFLIPTGAADGSRLVDWSTVRRMPFDLLLLLGSGITMANAFAPTGLSLALGELLRPWIDALPPFLLVLALVGAVSLFSEVASNTAVATLMLPIARDGAQVAGIDPLLLMLPVTIGASCSFMLPIGTPPNTIVFASRLIGFRQLAWAGIWLNVIATLLLAAALWCWALPLLGAAAVPGAPR